jgi:hypothetical protein
MAYGAGCRALTLDSGFTDAQGAAQPRLFGKPVNTGLGFDNDVGAKTFEVPVGTRIVGSHVVQAGGGQNMQRRDQEKGAWPGHVLLHLRRQVIEIG